MPRRCPPGVFCIENYTTLVIFMILFLATYVYFFNERKITTRSEVITMNMPLMTRANANYGYSNNKDILLNPYTPPLKNDGYQLPSQDVRGGVPINVRTRGYESSYSQIGILTPSTGNNQILPLMGRPLNNRDKWQYYTMSEINNIKLPISRGKRSCTNEYGCDQIYDGDTVYIQGYNSVFKATIYENDMFRYLPV